jgi:hypothetical protein
MSKTARKPKRSKSSLWRPVLGIAITLAIAAGALGAFHWLGGEALLHVKDRNRFRAGFTAIECDSPPGTDRTVFLREVRYVSDFPETFNPLDESDRERLTHAFLAHPWVAAVPDIRVEPGNRVIVKLLFREPFLTVRTADGIRMVDRNGVLLPESSVPPGTAELITAVPAPRTPAGRVWPDETVQRAVELTKTYSLKSLALTPREWRLTQRDGKLLHIER